MAEKIKYEDLTPAMQKAYDKENKLRKKWLIIGLIVGVLFGVIIVNMQGTVDFTTVTVGVVFAWMMSAIIVGTAHQRRWFSNIRHSMPLIPLGLIVMYFTLIPAGMLGYGLVPIDIVRFIIRKPLIFNSEIPKIVDTEEVAQEAYMKAAIEQSVTAKLNELKQMLDNGLISKDDFEKKKAEILNNM